MRQFPVQTPPAQHHKIYQLAKVPLLRRLSCLSPSCFRNLALRQTLETTIWFGPWKRAYCDRPTSPWPMKEWPNSQYQALMRRFFNRSNTRKFLILDGPETTCGRCRCLPQIKTDKISRLPDASQHPDGRRDVVGECRKPLALSCPPLHR